MARATSSPSPRVVAELGRPETPDETADRKAAASRLHRASQTTVNLVASLIVSLVVVLVIVLLVVRPDQQTVNAVDYQKIAVQAQAGIADPLIAPRVPKGWQANAATINPVSAGAYAWHIGFITAGRQYISFDQGIGVTDAWAAAQLGSSPATGTASIGGLTWTVYDRRTADQPGNFAYSLVTTIGRDVYLLHGTAVTAEFRQLAATTAAEIGAK
ncbi:MAG: hypothetical protein JWR53_998 [Glaciihabitans sp.]|jgi:hypothetical protein|nr:hypothetical protein [Glaciihabitans sp.]MCU1534517.1 hypothetical protein [Glaciihabitans sp.]